ncbi:MAG: winged helix-turn-helix domain-containing protein [Defluviitaleaceae bacterium]|nr:winged helix-turn-helix domain-containing protein [Defluviitaleaceae bacterium]
MGKRLLSTVASTRSRLLSDIKAAYQEKVVHRIGTAQIYYVLKRHDWRKVKPRSRHPKKASPEVIEASKKLTPESIS